MVEIKGGKFVMGQNDGEKDEQPEHIVEIDDFFMGKYEITVAEFRLFCEATNRPMPVAPEWGWKENHPIMNTSWFDAIAYIEWLNKQMNETYRLPTEAEFEYVIRNGGKTGVFPWDSDVPVNENLADQALKAKTSNERIWPNYNDGFAFTAPVGSFEANALGIHDINGNIWEWCQDWYQSYPIKKDISLKQDFKKTHKVGRGGSYNADPWHSRSASRAWVKPSFKKPGFRLAKSKVTN